MNFLLLFLFYLLVWVIFSGKFDAFHLSLGAFAAALIAFTSSRTLFKGSRGALHYLAMVPAAAGYGVWLVYQIVLANFHVFFLAFHPHLHREVTPRFIRFKTKLKSNYAKFILANSLTLTPGTITVSIKDDEYLIHAISEKSAQNVPGRMEAKIARIFDK